MVPQFIICFQNLQKKLTRSPPEVEVKELFLTTLWEPLQTTLAVLDFKTSTINQVIDVVTGQDKPLTQGVPLEHFTKGVVR